MKTSPALSLLAALVMAGCANAQPLNVQHPAAASYGQSLTESRATYERLCTSYEVRELDVATLPIATESHTQVDCQGFQHAGAKRLAEFVYADDALVFVWVLIEASEEAALLAALKDKFGEPTHEADTLVAFADDRVALRRDVPELLYYAESVAPLYQAFFDQASGQ